MHIQLTNLLCYIDLIVNRYTDIIAINQLILYIHIFKRGNLNCNTLPICTNPNRVLDSSGSKPQE